MSPTLARVALALTLVWGWAALAHGATYYVRASGDDAHDGLSPETAFASIRPAARLLLNPGDRLIVGPGVYREGNIKPRGSGSPDTPIVLFADVTGALTHDPPGPVTIVPPNTADATTGVIVYGRHDIVIEGFDVDGAADAGIQVRPHSRTGADSTRIVVRNNRTRNGRRKGIHLIAAGDVTVIGNTMTGNNGSGLALQGGASAPVRPLVTGNVIEENRLGIGIRDGAGGMIADNAVRANGKGLNMAHCDGMSVIRNQFVELRDRGITTRATNMTISENVIDRGVSLWEGGTVVFTKNRFANQDLGFDVSVGPAGTVQLLDNELPRTVVSGGAQIEVERNEGRVLEVQGAGAITATDNRFEHRLALKGAADLVAIRNHATSLQAIGASAVVRDNQFAGRAVISADTATVAGNRVGSLEVYRRPPLQDEQDRPDDEGGPFVIDGNQSADLLRVGQAQRPVSHGTVQDNDIGGMLRAFGRRELQVRRNQARGIACVLTAPDSALVLADNMSRDSDLAGLIVIGAGSAVVENNTSSANADSGLAARRSRNLVISGNEFLANPSGGISVLFPLAGDCNGDLHVTIDELITLVPIALGLPSQRSCAAADVDGDRVIAVDELVIAAAAALDTADTHDEDSRIEIRANRVEDNGRFGVNVFASGAVLASGNRVVRNAGIGIAVHGQRGREDVAIAGNLLGLSGAEGLLLEGAAGAQVRNNVIFSNREAGILLRDAPDVQVVNNLVYDNGDDGISVGLGTALPASSATLSNNTLYANAGWGVTIGTAGAPSIGTVILNNIVHRNGRGGVAAERESRADLAIGFNLNSDGYHPRILPDPTDFTADPRLVAPAGADGILGREGFADDDFHLQPSAPPSPAIDAGSTTAAALGITGSAVAGLASDSGTVDLGYHYGADAVEVR